MLHKQGVGKFALAVSLTLACSQVGRAATISLSTAGTPSGNAGGSFSFVNGINISVPSVPDVLAIGNFQYSTTPGSNTIVDVTLTPTVNGISTNLVFVGNLTTMGSAYILTFNPASTAGAFTINNLATGNINFTALMFNGYDFGIQSQFQLNSSQNGKMTPVEGFVQTVPEPATASLFALASLGAALFMRRKMQSR